MQHACNCAARGVVVRYVVGGGGGGGLWAELLGDVNPRKLNHKMFENSLSAKLIVPLKISSYTVDVCGLISTLCVQFIVTTHKISYRLYNTVNWEIFVVEISRCYVRKCSLLTLTCMVRGHLYKNYSTQFFVRHTCMYVKHGHFAIYSIIIITVHCRYKFVCDHCERSFGSMPW